MDDITSFLNKSVEDTKFTNEEKQWLEKYITDHRLSAHQISAFRNRVFNLATEQITESNYQQVMEWVSAASKTFNSLVESYQARAFFSPGQSCREAIITEIREANEHIDICVFTISDNEIAEAIIAAHGKGLPIRIVTDNDKLFDRGSDIRLLKQNGLDIKVDNTRHHMHHKFMIIDGRRVLTGSYNWTRSAAEYNQENIIISSEPGAVKDYSTEFNRLWSILDFLNV